MRRVFAFIALVFVAASVHAAAIDWSISGATFTKPDGTPSGMRNWQVYVFDSAVRDDVTAALLASAPGSIDLGASWLVQDTTGASGAAGGTILGLTGGSAECFFVVFDSTALTTATHYLISSNQSAATYDNTDPLIPPTDINTATWTTGASGGAWQSVVPEPTSLALLALGVAAIGLRRKVK